MAIYDYSNIPTTLAVGDIINFSSVGLKKVVLPIGQYKLEVWGAQGGNANDTILGGLGGYEVYNNNQLIHNLVPMIEKNKAFLYDKITGKSYEILNYNNENAYFDLNYGPEIFAKTISLPNFKNKNDNFEYVQNPCTIKVFPVDKEGKFYFDNSPLLYI